MESLEHKPSKLINVSDTFFIKASLFLLTLTPLVVLNGAISPYAFSKIFFIRLGVALFLISLAVYVFRKRKEHNLSIDFHKLKNPIFLTLLVFTAFVTLSTILGDNVYRSFFGDIGRGMGLLTVYYSLLITVGVVLFFKKKDWMIFFKANIIASFIVFGDFIWEGLVNGVPRPTGYFINNPAFAAIYALFIIFVSWSLISSTRSKLWRYIGAINILTALATIFVTKTRGVFVGIFVALVVTSIWALFQNQNNRLTIWKARVSYKAIASIVLISISLVATVFITTHEAVFWQKVPGFDRLAQISETDNNTQTRILNNFVALDSINPQNVGLTRFLFGWGPENFNVAYEEYYNPAIQKYSLSWFDRAHNQVMDVLVMNGLFGLVAYLALWYLITKNIFSRKRSYKKEGLRLAALFFAVSYFTQNLFLFDQVSAQVPLYAFYGWMIYQTGISNENEASSSKIPPRYTNTAVYTLAFLSVIGFIWLSLIPLKQMSYVVDGLKSADFTGVVNNIETITEPYNYTQEEIRFQILSISTVFTKTPEAKDFIIKAVALQEETLESAPIKPRTLEGISFTYTILGKLYDEDELTLLGEQRIKDAIEESPNRQELYHFLADNLVAQGHFGEAKDAIIHARDLEPEGRRANFYYLNILMPYEWHNQLGVMDEFRRVYIENGEKLEESRVRFFRDSYTNHLTYFFKQQDVQSFARTMEQAIVIEEAVSEVNRYQLENGIAEHEIASDVDRIRSGLQAFQARGWDAIAKEAL